MTLVEIFILAAALSADAFSAALAAGLSHAGSSKKSAALKMAFFFGFFQFIMPIIGNGTTLFFLEFADKYSDALVFAILVFLGVRMIFETPGGNEISKNVFSLPSIILLAFATSIDALAAGITLGAADAPILLSGSIIGLTTFVLSYCGVIIGGYADLQKSRYAGIIGGIMLILLGLHSLIAVILRMV